jgi:hypothetical protein
MQTYQQYLLESKKEKKFYDPNSAYWYVFNTGNRDPKAIEMIKKDTGSIWLYAKNVLKRRWLEMEPDVIKGDFQVLLDYLKEVVQDRWPEAESRFSKDSFKWYHYIDALKHMTFTIDDRWKWLKEGITENLIWILNAIKMTKEQQEYIIEQRPDLIKLIQNLDPDLKKERGHELGLSDIDI